MGLNRGSHGFDPVGYEPWSGGGAHIMRAKMTQALTPEDENATAKIYAWVHAANDLGPKQITVKVYDPTERVTLEVDDIVWIIRRPDAKGETYFGRWELLSFPATSTLRWAKATAKWTNNSGNGSTVTCNECTDRDGTLRLDDDDNPIPITIYLPRPDGGPKKATDPNVQTGDVIGYIFDEEGDPICVTDVNDDAIGSVKFWNDVLGNIPRGWRRMTGAEGRFLVATGAGEPPEFDPSVLGSSGGNTKHKHTYTPTGVISEATTGITAEGSGTASLSGGGISGSGTASVTFGTTAGTLFTEPAEDFVEIEDHTGSVNVACTSYGVQSGGTNIPSLSTCPSVNALSVSAHVIEDYHVHEISKSALAASLTGTVSISTIAAGLSLTGSVDLSGLTIDITDPGHTHDFEGSEGETSEEYHIPPWFSLYLIERFE